MLDVPLPVLGDIGADAHETASEDAFRHAEPDDLDHRATRLRGCALHAFATAVDLAVRAGRLEQLAEVRRVVRDVDDEGG